MTDPIREQISALLDGELAKDELGLLVRRMERDPELRRTFGNYVLLGEVLRAPGGAVASRSFAARVYAEIDEQPAPAPDSVERNVSPGSRWMRPVVASAVAASAAVAAVLMWRPDTQEATRLAEQLPAAEDARIVEPQVVAAASPTLEQSQRLATYLVAHSQFSSPIGRRNVLMNVLADDPGIERVAFEAFESP